MAPERYLRILANPFLAYAGFVFWLRVLAWLIGLLRKNPELIGPLAPIITILMLVCLFGLIPGLFRFHCLDCGTTGRLKRWRSHSCLIANLRRQTGRARLISGPNPLVQNILWLWFLLILFWTLHEWGFSWSLAS